MKYALFGTQAPHAAFEPRTARAYCEGRQAFITGGTGSPITAVNPFTVERERENYYSFLSGYADAQSGIAQNITHCGGDQGVLPAPAPAAVSIITADGTDVIPAIIEFTGFFPAGTQVQGQSTTDIIGLNGYDYTNTTDMSSVGYAFAFADYARGADGNTWEATSNQCEALAHNGDTVINLAMWIIV